MMRFAEPEIVTPLHGKQLQREGARVGFDSGKQLRRDYQSLVKASYDDVDTAKLRLNDWGYDLDPRLSTPDTKVAVHRESGRPVVLHRGSTTAKDWLVSDALIAVGAADELDPRHAKARAITKKARRKYKQPVAAVGHSLGGRLAERSGADGPVLAVNPAVGAADAFGRRGAKTQILRTTLDPVSLLDVTRRGGKSKSVKTTSMSVVPGLGSHRVPKINFV